MPVLEAKGTEVELNDEGFMVNSDEWTPELAEVLAEEYGIGALTERHWKVITFCREDTAQNGQPPGLRRISKLSGVPTKELYQLFPKGPGKLAAKVSGLPKPKACI